MEVGVVTPQASDQRLDPDVRFIVSDKRECALVTDPGLQQSRVNAQAAQADQSMLQ